MKKYLIFIDALCFVSGEGDTGDHWTVICDNEFWERDEEIMLKHVDTNV